MCLCFVLPRHNPPRSDIWYSASVPNTAQHPMDQDAPLHVPQVDLLDETIEPTDEELELLMRDFLHTVNERAAKAEAAERASLAAALRVA